MCDATQYVEPPTPQEIRERAAAVRMTWDAATRRKREVQPSEHVRIPVVSVLGEEVELLAENDRRTHAW